MAGPPSASSDAAGDACREYANAQAVSPHGSGGAVPRCNSAALVPAPRRRSQRLAALNTAKVHKVAQSQRAEPAAQLASSDSEDAGSAYSAGSSCGSSGGLGDSASEAAGSPVHAQWARAPPQFVRAATASPSVHEQLFRHLQCARPATPVAAGNSPPAAPASSPSLRDKLSATLKRARGQRAEVSGKGTKRARRSGSAVKWNEQSVRAESPAPTEATWVPPVSPFGLIEEQLYHDPWKLLLACMLLNKTNATKVRAVWPRLMALAPTPEAACAASPDALEATIHSLGFHRSRARSIGAMSHDYLHTAWSRPSQLRFVGKYASDAYFIFCRGKWRGVQPEDKELKRYHAWLQTHDGASTGLERDPLL